MRALFPGSFDPVTNGHLDLIERVVALVDEVVVAVAVNVEKRPLLTDAERLALLRDACRRWPTVRAEVFNGLVVDAARACGAGLIVRGVRSGADCDRELGMAQMNRRLSGIETLLLPASPTVSFISSSLVREIARVGGDISPFVPPAVADCVYRRVHSS